MIVSRNEGSATGAGLAAGLPAGLVAAGVSPAGAGVGVAAFGTGAGVGAVAGAGLACCCCWMRASSAFLSSSSRFWSAAFLSASLGPAAGAGAGAGAGAAALPCVVPEPVPVSLGGTSRSRPSSPPAARAVAAPRHSLICRPTSCEASRVSSACHSSRDGILRTAPRCRRLMLPSNASGLARKVEIMKRLASLRVVAPERCAIADSESFLTTRYSEPGADAAAAGGVAAGAGGGALGSLGSRCTVPAAAPFGVPVVGAATGGAALGFCSNTGGSRRTVYSRTSWPRGQLTSTRKVMNGSVIVSTERTDSTVRPPASRATVKVRSDRYCGRSSPCLVNVSRDASVARSCSRSSGLAPSTSMSADRGWFSAELRWMSPSPSACASAGTQSSNPNSRWDFLIIDLPRAHPALAKNRRCAGPNARHRP